MFNLKSTLSENCPTFLSPIAEPFKTSPLARRLAHGAFWSLCGALVARGLGLTAAIVVARVLGKEGFGMLGVIQSTIGMFGIFAGYGLGMASTKFVAQYRTTDPSKAGRIRALCSVLAWISGGIVAAVMFFTAPWLAERVLDAPQLGSLLRIGSLFLLLTSVSGVQTGTLTGFEAFKAVAKINFWSGLANFLLVLAGIYLDGLRGAVWGMTVASGISWLLNHVAIRKESARAGIPCTYTGFWSEAPIIRHFALPAMISSIFMAPTEWILDAILVNSPGGYGEMGLYNAAKQWHLIIVYFPAMISTMTFPVLSNLFGESEKQKYDKMLITTLFLFSGISLIIAVPVMIFSKSIMGIYGANFSEGRLVLVTMAVYSVLYVPNVVLGQALWSAGLSRTAMILSAVRAGVLLCTFIFLMPKSALGMAQAFTIAMFLQTLYQGIIVVKHVRGSRGDSLTGEEQKADCTSEYQV